MTRLLPPAARGCFWKARFPTRAQAAAGLTANAHVYECVVCDGWHATTKQEKDHQ